MQPPRKPNLKPLPENRSEAVLSAIRFRLHCIFTANESNESEEHCHNHMCHEHPASINKRRDSRRKLNNPKQASRGRSTH